MKILLQSARLIILFVATSLLGCALIEQPTKKEASLGLIVTPPSYYTTIRARYLGEKYKENLQRLVERVVQNPVTAKLQFANNIASVGGIGFFTHSATKSMDERYLEVMLGAPDVFDVKADFNSKVGQLFSQYGSELLSILTRDSEIYNDSEVAGYGLNFSWRNTSQSPSGPRVTLERAVIYVAKADIRKFLSRQVGPNDILGGSVIFALQEEGPARLVSYLSQTASAAAQLMPQKESAAKAVEAKPDVNPKIQEQDLPPQKKDEKRSPLPIAKVPVQEQLKRQDEARKQEEAAKRAEQAKQEEEARRRVEETKRQEAVRRADAAKLAEIARQEDLKRQEESKKREEESKRAAEEARLKKEAKHREDLQRAEVSVKKEAEHLALKTKEEPSPFRSPLIKDSSRQTGVKGPAQKEANIGKPETSTAMLKPSLPPSTPSVAPKHTGSTYVVQFSFAGKDEAQRWFDRLRKEGYSTSMSIAGEGESVRLRVGNFPSHGEASRVLGKLRGEGIKGIVVEAAN
jgi:cell division protein FtsN